jgi:prolipoprotein diacylglyceryltransferase
MHQILFHIPGTSIPVYGYGVMLVVGFIAGMYLAQFLARRSKLDPEIFANAAILALVTGVLGARLSHVLENLPEYTRGDITVWQNFLNAINIREGGLTYYGGFLLAFPSLVLYALWKKLPLPLGMDIVAPCLMVGLAFGRIGCYLNGCCYGAACSPQLGVEFPYGSDAYITQFNKNQLQQPVPRELIRDHCALGEYMDAQPTPLAQIQEPMTGYLFAKVDSNTLKKWDQIQKEGHTALADKQHANPVHAAEIYSSVTAFLIAAFLLAYFTLPHVPGRVFAAMMMIEGVFRYVLEMLRVEPAVIGRGTKYLTSLPPQTYSMVVSFILVIGGAALWYVFGRIAGGGAKSGAIHANPATA